MGRLLSAALVVTAVAAAVVIAAGGVEVPPEPRKVTAESDRAPRTAPAREQPRKLPVAATVRMRELAFVPSNVSARRGAVVRFRNQDDVEHDVFVQPPGDLSAGPVAQSRRILPGKSFSVTLPGTGAFRFACTLHPTVMQGRIESRRAA